MTFVGVKHPWSLYLSVLNGLAFPPTCCACPPLTGWPTAGGLQEQQRPGGRAVPVRHRYRQYGTGQGPPALPHPLRGSATAEIQREFPARPLRQGPGQLHDNYYYYHIIIITFCKFLFYYCFYFLLLFIWFYFILFIIILLFLFLLIIITIIIIALIGMVPSWHNRPDITPPWLTGR